MANFYSTGDKNHGLMFHKNLCDSFIVNEEQGNIYFLNQEQPKLNSRGEKTLKYVLKKIEYKSNCFSQPNEVNGKIPESKLS